ncbi:MAG TPA: hypothetical protein DDW93_09910, partial [Firmicutes bacterium]|nr:hypothetical protein [Bacillota bacterium]
MDVTVFFNNLTPQERLVFIILLFQGVFMVILVIAGIRLKKLLNRYRQLLTGSSQNNLEGLL